MYSITENIYYSQLSSVAILLQPEPNCLTSCNTWKWLCFLSLCAIVFRSPPASHVSSSNGQWSSQLFCVCYNCDVYVSWRCFRHIKHNLLFCHLNHTVCVTKSSWLFRLWKFSYLMHLSLIFAEWILRNTGNGGWIPCRVHCDSSRRFRHVIFV
jgi:hypothetical protein